MKKNVVIDKDVYALAKKLESEALEQLGWRLTPVWGVFRDRAERLLGKSLLVDGKVVK